MFFLQDRFLMIPVHPENKIREESSQRKRNRQVELYTAGQTYRAIRTW